MSACNEVRVTVTENRLTVFANSPSQITVTPKVNALKVAPVGVQGPKGDTGPQGPQGADSTVPGPQGDPGTSYQEQFETVSKNLNSWEAAFNYTGGLLTSIVYTSGASTIAKTFNRTGDALTSIVLSGDTPAGIQLTKTLTYTGDSLTGVSYS